MANRRFIDFPIASTSGDSDIILIWQDGANKQTTKATFLSGLPENLDELNDVAIAGLTNGQILRYDSVTGKWENTDQGNLDLNDLNDVSIVSPSNGQVLVYNSSTSQWENSSAGFVPYTGAVTTVNLGAQTIQAGSFVKAGGTSAQFLKADGSVDSSTYGTGTVTSVALTMPAAFSVANSPVTTAGTLAVTGAGNASQYIAGDGTLVSFPALTGYVPYTGANQTVNLNTQQLQAGHTTLTTNGSTETLTINHTSGSGKAINVTKGGNGEGLYINKTSGSGNAATIIGTLEATTLKKTGGTSAQFLKADGSVDSSTYGTGTVTSVGLSSATSGVTIGSTPVTTSGTITLAIATASGSQNGLLSSTDWTTFNGKQNALTNPVTGTGASGQVAYFNGTTTITSESGLLWDASNNILGINTITPDFNSKLDVNGQAFVARLAVYDNNGTPILGTSPMFYSPASGTLAISTNASLRMLISNTGNVQIGSVTPTNSRLLVSGTHVSGHGIFGVVPVGNNTATIALYNSSVVRKGLLFADTGFVRLDTDGDPLQLYSNGNIGLQVFANGNLFVGSSPSDNGARLQVSGTSSVIGSFISSAGESILRLQNTATNGRDWFIIAGGNIGSFNSGQFGIYDATATQPRFSINSTGDATFNNNVTANSFIKSGGTSSQFLKADGSVDSTTYVPSTRTITINGTSQDLSANRTYNVGTVTSVTASSPLFSSGGTTPNITIQQASGSQNGFLSSSDWTTFNSKVSSQWVTTGSNIYYNSGIVIVGNTTNVGDGPLQVSGTATTYASFNSTNAGGSFISLARNGVQIGAIGNSGNMGVGILDDFELTAQSGKNIHLRTSSGQLSVLSGGSVLVGTGLTSNGAKLQVGGTLTTTGDISLMNASGDIHIRMKDSSGNADRVLLRQASTNDVYVGDIDANGGQLIIRTNGNDRVTIASGGSATFSSLGTGTVSATSGTLSTSSDMNFKIDDGFIDSAIDKVLSLKPRYFYWNEISGLPTNIRQLGFYAQEVNEALGEEAANKPKDLNTPWGISDRSIIAMLTKAIQELKQEIDTLKN